MRTRLFFILPAIIILTVILLIFGGIFKRVAANVYAAGDSVSVFEPRHYDPSQHSPSPIFTGELLPLEGVDVSCSLVPRFTKRFGRSVVTIDTGDADLYGTGEVEGNLRRNGDKQDLWNTDNPTGMLYKGKRMYQSHPWVLGVRKDGSAFGIIADNTWKSSLSLKRGVCFSSEGPAFRVVIIEKENPEQVLRTLAELSGRMALPPVWTLGYQQCRYSYYPDTRVKGIADTLRMKNIPCDVIWMDIHYMDDYRIFTFDPVKFPDPEGLNDYLHAKDFHSVYMIDPGIKDEQGYFVDDQGREGDFYVRDRKGKVYHGPVWAGESHFPDYTRPDVCKWWSGLYGDFIAKGVDGVWNDMNDPSIFCDFGGTMPKSNVHKGGVVLDESDKPLPESVHLRYHNIYGYLMVKATREGVMAAEPAKRPFVLSRSNFLGGQRYAAMWTGDNYSDYAPMKMAVPMCLNVGLSGQPFNGPDIGGFLRDCTPELLRHWTAYGVYFPFVRNHSAIGTANQEPWAFDQGTEDVCRTAINRRYMLLPYYYTLFEEASRTGVPVMRPLFWADFKDNDLRAEQQAFLVGNDLLVIPRWAESPVLPKGDWRLFPLEAEDDGYQSYMALRSGAVLPLTGVVQSTADYSTEALTLLVNPDADGNASGVLYCDAGDGYGYQNGEYARYEFNANVSEDGILTVDAVQTDGNISGTVKKLRIGYVCGGKVVYSDWSEGLAVSMDINGIATSAVDADALSFVHLENGSISHKQTKRELLLINLF